MRRREVGILLTVHEDENNNGLGTSAREVLRRDPAHGTHRPFVNDRTKGTDTKNLGGGPLDRTVSSLGCHQRKVIFSYVVDRDWICLHSRFAKVVSRILDACEDLKIDSEVLDLASSL
ncbi:hypothetical protein CEXT_674481 [Caerostris extrusa]|uniref:Uncharacterized protein n=1 Tax=Caerostris extrusa TaxID=172846 RepID=A0AAV4S8N1_CAEEX|nr:hypothetical protein CEXT_674481 [Caerostris extrusa]